MPNLVLDNNRSLPYAITAAQGNVQNNREMAASRSNSMVKALTDNNAQLYETLRGTADITDTDQRNQLQSQIQAQIKMNRDAVINQNSPEYNAQYIDSNGNIGWKAAAAGIPQHTYVANQEFGYQLQPGSYDSANIGITGTGYNDKVYRGNLINRLAQPVNSGFTGPSSQTFLNALRNLGIIP